VTVFDAVTDTVTGSRCRIGSQRWSLPLPLERREAGEE
jgi:hypothetical protein